jgi:16S rRNA (cytosine967-C5)-methyltransferase
MSRFYSHINTAATIINQYQGQEPLAIFLKQFFSANKKYGSKDRREISKLTYQYYRVNNALTGTDITQKILTAHFYCEQASSPLLEAINPQWNQQIASDLATKNAIVGQAVAAHNLFLFTSELSSAVAVDAHAYSFLRQPQFFLRIRPGHHQTVAAKLAAISIPFKNIGANCLAMPNGTMLDDELNLDKEAVVQDYNSQQVGEVLKPYITTLKQPTTVWDCCAASGGKSIMLYDIIKNMQLTVSDIRQSILHNLNKRFLKAGIANYQQFEADLSTNKTNLSTNKKYDIVLADVPCTGSGTWGRTPERQSFFNSNTIQEFAAKQQKILQNLLPHIVPGGYLVYITCSVFKQENEDQITTILTNKTLQLKEMQLLPGYHLQADTMFVAILQKGI